MDANHNLYDALVGPGDGPDGVFLRTEAGRAWTRSDIADLSGRMAAVLEEVGVAIGDRVAVQVEKSAEAVCLYLACLRIGAIYVPINPAFTRAESDHILRDAEPSLYVCGADAVVGRAGAGGPAPIVLDGHREGTLMRRARKARAPASSAPVRREDAAAILYTSGTTGTPKGAAITHGNLGYCAAALVELWGIGADDVLLHALPVFHAHGLFIAVNAILRARGTMIFLSRFTADAAVRHLPDSTVFMGVPTFYTRLLADARLNRRLCARMRLFVSGSAPLPAAVFAEFEARTGHAILERYGMTETTIIASNPLAGPRVPGTVGFALPGVEVDVRGRSAARLGPGEVGELVVRGPNVFAGYWRMPEKTAAEHTPDGYFRTGDLATLGPDGRITVVGREKDLIISGGFNVYPQEVEVELCRLEGVRDSAVVGAAHPDFGEGVVAVIEMKPGFARPGPDEVIASLAARLARYKLPKVVVFVNELPRNALGKTQKTMLREAHRDAFAPHGAPEP